MNPNQIKKFSSNLSFLMFIVLVVPFLEMHSQSSKDDIVIDLKITPLHRFCNEFGLNQKSSVNGIKAFLKSLKEKPENLLHYQCTCSANLFIEDYIQAESECSKGISIERNPELLETRYNVYNNLKKYDLAESDLTEILDNKSLKPKARHFLNRENLKSIRSDLSGALADYEEAFLLEPKSIYKLSINRMLLKLNRREEACNSLKEMIDQKYIDAYFFGIEKDFNENCKK